MSASIRREGVGNLSRLGVAVPREETQDGPSVEEVQRKIINGIFQRIYTPAKRLGEVSLANDMKCGQAIVRSAMDRLAFAGILERRHRSGTYVRKISPDEFVEMCQVRALLEGFACRQACKHATAEQLNGLELLGRRLDEWLDELDSTTYEQAQELEFEFHQNITELSRNSVLTRILNRQQMIIRLLKTSYDLPNAYEKVVGDAPGHVEVVKAIRQGNPDEAERTMRAHILDPLAANLRKEFMNHT